MISDLSTTELAAVAGGAVVVLVLLGFVIRALLQRRGEDDTDVVEDVASAEVEHEMDESAVPDGGHVLTLQQPKTKKDSLPVKLYKLHKFDKGKQKIGEEGYVRWFLIDDTVSEPKYVKPERKGGGVPEYEYNGETYLFPRDALKPDEETGMWTAMHREGDAAPLNLETPGRPTIATDELKEYLTKRVTSSPPSWMSNLFGDFETADLMKLVIVGFIAFVLLQSALGGVF